MIQMQFKIDIFHAFSVFQIKWAKRLCCALKSHLRLKVKLYDITEFPKINKTYLKVDVCWDST